MSLPMSMASQIFQPEEGIPLQHIVLEPITTVMITPGTPPSEENKIKCLRSHSTSFSDLGSRESWCW